MFRRYARLQQAIWLISFVLGMPTAQKSTQGKSIFLNQPTVDRNSLFIGGMGLFVGVLSSFLLVAYLNQDREINLLLFTVQQVKKTDKDEIYNYLDTQLIRHGENHSENRRSFSRKELIELLKNYELAPKIEEIDDNDP